MNKTVKCAGCGKTVPKDVAYVAEHITKGGNKVRKYYCSEHEYKRIEAERENRSAVYKELLKYFPMVNNTSNLPKILFCDLNGIVAEKKWSGILEYLQYDEEYLSGALQKDFVSYDVRAKYLVKVIINRIDKALGEKKRVETQRVSVQKQSEDMFVTPIKTIKREAKKGLDELLEDL